MLSIEEGKCLIEDESLSAEELIEIRDSIQILSEIIIEQWLSDRKVPAYKGGHDE